MMRVLSTTKCITKKIRTMSEIYQLPESNSGNNATIPFSIPIGFGGMGNNGFGFGNGGFNSIADLFGLAIIASMFGWGNGGFGGGFGNNNGSAAFLSNQLANDSGRDLIMQAVTNQGEASRTAIQTLSTMLGQDFNLTNAGIQSAQNTLNQIANAQGMSTLQLINAVQAGDANLASTIQKCCCDNQLALCQQTNALQNSINGVNDNITATRAAQQLSDCQQTYALTDTMNRNYLALDNKIDQLESNRKDREITALTAEVATLKSQNFTTGVVQQAVAPVIGQLNGLAREVDDIKCRMPETVSVQYPNLQVFNATPYVSGGFYGQPWGGFYGNGFGNNVVF
jgi:cellobiose-specific phosphotransferase system component IIA